MILSLKNDVQSIQTDILNTDNKIDVLSKSIDNEDLFQK